MKKKILIAEDDANILISLDYLLRKNGFDVFVARNGKEAWKIAKIEKPHAILLDIMMPFLDGFEVCLNIKNNPETRDGKIIFLSAKSLEEDIKKGYACGASAYITKPFGNKEIIEKINELLQ